MKQKIEKFFKILNIELEDLEEDISILVEEYKQKRDKDEISSYVFLENACVLKEELYGIKRIVDSLKDIAVENYKNINDIVDDIHKLIKEQTKLYLMNGCIAAVIERKISKVLEFMNEN